jgi:Na+/glutamate symporter
MLVSCRAVSQPERQYLAFIGAVTRSERSQLFWLRIYTDTVKRLSNIELRVYLSFAQPGQEFINQG